MGDGGWLAGSAGFGSESDDREDRNHQRDLLRGLHLRSPGLTIAWYAPRYWPAQPRWCTTDRSNPGVAIAVARSISGCASRRHAVWLEFR